MCMHYQKVACVYALSEGSMCVCIIRRQHVCMHYQKVACVYALSEGSMCAMLQSDCGLVVGLPAGCFGLIPLLRQCRCTSLLQCLGRRELEAAPHHARLASG